MKKITSYSFSPEAQGKAEYVDTSYRIVSAISLRLLHGGVLSC